MANIYDEMIWNARQADLGRFMLDNYPEMVIREGSIWMRLW